MDDGDHAWVMAAPSSTWQLLTVGWVRNCCFKGLYLICSFLRGVGGGVKKSLTRTDPSCRPFLGPLVTIFDSADSAMLKAVSDYPLTLLG